MASGDCLQFWSIYFNFAAVRNAFLMKIFTCIDFNNARISCKKILIFELYSMFLVIITVVLLHPFIDNYKERFAMKILSKVEAD